MPLFNQRVTKETAVNKINEAKKLLANIAQEHKFVFLEMLELRVTDFESALKINEDPYEREQIIQQYNRFAQTVYHCLSQPKQTSLYTKSYHNFKYYPVGISPDNVIFNPVAHNTAIAASVLGAALILASLAAFAFNPTIGAILLPIGITLLAPSSISLITPDPLDTSSKKLEEQLIFQAAAKLIDSSITFTNIEENEEPIHEKCCYVI